MPLSLSARRAWIEIEAVTPMQIGIMVALRKESVDRNCALLRAVGSLTVALRKESVDRNICCHLLNIPAGKVALRKESVDRNDCWIKSSGAAVLSLSARRAWIEIFAVISLIYQQAKSLSARRAWIEIGLLPRNTTGTPGRSPQGERG